MGIIELGGAMDLLRSLFGPGSAQENDNVAMSTSASASASAYPYGATGRLNSSNPLSTQAPLGKGKKRAMNNNIGEEVVALEQTNDFRASESYDDFKRRILNIAINAGDCYKDLTPAFTVEGIEDDEFALNSEAAETATTSTGASGARRGKLALSAKQKKEVFDQLLVYMFDLNGEVATKSLRYYVDAAKKDAFKSKVTTFFYKDGFDVGPINDTNNVTTSIKNFVEENYFQCPKGRNFKYNLHMSEDDKQKFPLLGIDGINIIYDAAGVLPHNIFLPGSYEIICTPGSYIDPGTKIKNPVEIPNIKTSKGVIPDSLRGQPNTYTIGDDILRSYGLSDIITSIVVTYEGLTKKEPRRPQESFRVSFAVNTRKSEKLLRPDEVGSIHFNSTSIGSGFGFKELNSFDQHQLQLINGVRKGAAEYFKGNAHKNKFIYTNHQNFIGEINNNAKEDYNITNEFIKYIIMKELGDTLQVAWLDVITQDPSFIGASGKQITKDNTFVMTGDAMLIARCILNGYNCIYLSGASSTFYLNNISASTLPLLSEKLPELKPNPEEIVRAARKLGPKTPIAAFSSAMVRDEEYIIYPINTDDSDALKGYLAHNQGVINSLIDKGNAEKSIPGKDIWFYLAAYLKHHTDEMYKALKRSGADADTIKMFHFKILDDGAVEDDFYSFLDVGASFGAPIEEIPVSKIGGSQQYICYSRTEADVIWRKLFTTGEYNYYAGAYDELFEKISMGMSAEEKGLFYAKYYSYLKYPSELVTDIRQINTIIENFNTYNPLYNIAESDLIEQKTVAYFLNKLEASSNDDISIVNTTISPGDRCYFGKEVETGRTPRKRAALATPAKPAKQGGGALTYEERPTDYELETYRAYFANPGYATFYALSRFPRVFLMGYSIMRFLRKMLNARTSEIDALFKFCEDALDPQLSKLLTEVFLHVDEPNYYYNVDSEAELEKQIKYMANLDTFMYYTIEIVRVVSEGTGLFAAGNEILMGTIRGMFEGRVPVSSSVIVPELEKALVENRDIFVIVGTKFFRALIQNYNDLADVGKADMVNSISCYEHKIKNSVMSGVEEIMMPLEILIKERKHIKPYTPSTRERVDMSGFWRKNIGETENRLRGYLNRWGPIVTNVNKRAVSRGRKNIGKSVSGLFPKQAPRSEGRFTQSRIRARSGRRGEGREPNRETVEELFANNNSWGGARPKTKKRTALKPKRTRRKERK